MRCHFAAVAAMVLLAVGCDRSGQAKNPGESQACPDGTTVVQVDCSSLLKYDAPKVDAQLQVMKWAKARVETSTEVLREVSDGFKHLDQQFHRSCAMYNACALDAETFQEQLARAETREQTVRACTALAEAAGDDPEGYRAALTCLHQEAVPPSENDSLALTFTVQALRAGETETRTLHGGETLHTGDHVVFGLTLSREAHVYLLQRTGPERRLDVLFPNPATIPASNPLPGGQLVRMPPSGKSYRINESDIGTEQVFIIASTEPIADLARALESLAGGQDAAGAVTSQVVDLFAEVQASCDDEARGLDPADDCDLIRGLTPSDVGADDPFFAGTDASVRARAEPWDDTIMQVFTFEHAE